MIELLRVRTDQAIHLNFRGNKRVDFNKELLIQERELSQGNIKGRKFAESRWGVTKKQLFLETKGKCAYCEADTKIVAHGDVEHYRPKSIYWWLAYCYDNYLVSCAICNQVHKKDKFPTLNTRMFGLDISSETTNEEIHLLANRLNPDPLIETEGLGYEDFKSLHSTERPLLINPYYENPEDYFAYEADDILREVSIISLTDDVIPFVEASVDVYGLNRKELVDLRYKHFVLYDTFCLTLIDKGISLVTQQRNEMAIRGMMSQDAAFSGMIRYFERLRTGN
jgi:uncharacterized protein (TIGR02646 family)